jgi:hypothetical protein
MIHLPAIATGAVGCGFIPPLRHLIEYSGASLMATAPQHLLGGGAMDRDALPL